MSKIILVTGGSSGIGRSICTYLAQQGCIVYGTSRSADFDQPIDNFKLVPLDVLADESVEKAIQHIVKRHGHIDVLVNNAGIGIAGPIEETCIKDAQATFETNVFGLLRVCQHVLPHMRKAGSGSIINVSSLGGLMGLPFRGIYSSSKFAVEGMTEALSVEAKRYGVKVTIVEPGDFQTNINQNRFISTLPSDSPYKDNYERLLQIINDEVTYGKDPIMVAKLIYKIINKPSPRLRYRVGTPMQKAAVYIKRLVSGRTFENMLYRHYKLK